MTKYGDKRKWIDTYQEVFLGSIVFGIFAGILISSALGEVFYSMEYFACPGSILLMLIFSIAAYNVYGSQRYTIRKFFLVETPAARHLVNSVLEAKNLPYQQTPKGFQVDTVEIRIRSSVMGRGGPEGTTIVLGPYRGRDRLLIDSLKEKIDEAFSPRGV